MESLKSRAPTARICCLDLDTFFVSVERLHRPELIGQPVVVGALPGSRGVVTAASYEVRANGVRSGMPIAEAYRRAPQANYVSGRNGEYSRYAARVKAILDRYAPRVQTASIDEFFLDFHHCEAMYRSEYRRVVDDDAIIERAVSEMRQAIQDELGLPASAGLATSRPVAKIASGLAKPAGVRLVRAGDEHRFVANLPVRRWPGIGPVAQHRLQTAGVETLGQLVDAPGALADAVRKFVFTQSDDSLGRDRPAFREHDPTDSTLGSISNERTFAADVGDHDAILKQLGSLCERVAWRVRQRQVRAQTVTLKLRYANFETLTRSRTVGATSDETTIFRCVRRLFASNYDRRRRVRLVGVCLSKLIRPERQLMLPFDARDRVDVAHAIDAVRDHCGYDAIHLGFNPSSRRRD